MERRAGGLCAVVPSLLDVSGPPWTVPGGLVRQTSNAQTRNRQGADAAVGPALHRGWIRASRLGSAGPESTVDRVLSFDRGADFGPMEALPPQRPGARRFGASGGGAMKIVLLAA